MKKEAQTYQYQNIKDLETKALKERLEELESYKRKYESDIYNYSHNKNWGKESLHQLKINLEEINRKIKDTQRKLENVDLLKRENILTTRSLRRNNAKYDDNNDKIDQYSSAIESQKQAISRMKDGAIKRRAIKRVSKLEEKLKKLEAKGIKLQEKQIKKIVNKETLASHRYRRMVKFAAKAQVYKNYAKDASIAKEMEGISSFQKHRYARQEKKYDKKYKKNKKKFNKLKRLYNSKNTVKSANPTTIPVDAIRRVRVKDVSNIKRHP